MEWHEIPGHKKKAHRLNIVKRRTLCGIPLPEKYELKGKGSDQQRCWKCKRRHALGLT